MLRVWPICASSSRKTVLQCPLLEKDSLCTVDLFPACFLCLHPDWSKNIHTCVSFTQFFFFQSTKCFKDVAELQVKLQLLLSAVAHMVGPESAPVEACCYGNQYTNRKLYTPNNKGRASCFLFSCFCTCPNLFHCLPWWAAPLIRLCIALWGSKI